MQNIERQKPSSTKALHANRKKTARKIEKNAKNIFQPIFFYRFNNNIQCNIDDELVCREFVKETLFQ